MRPLRPLLLAAAAAAALLHAPSARAEEPPPEPLRYPPSSVRPKLIAGGVLITGVGYGAAFLGSEAAPNWPGAAELKVPVIGPWWALAQNGCPVNREVHAETGVGRALSVSRENCEAFEYLRLGLLVLDGLVQAAGVAIVAEAITMKTEGTPSAPVKAALSGFQLGGFTVRPSPLVSPTTAGIGFVGTF